MTAQALMLATPRRCSGCRKTGCDFSPTNHYCRPCVKAKNAERYAQQQRTIHEAQLIRAAVGDAEIVQLSKGVDGGTEDTLRRAMAAFMRQHGFGRMRVALVRLENELAKSHRRELAIEGWIT